MSRKWMIRTRTNHLLGPIPKQKLLELIENGSVSLDDEICSGNGYWFHLREADLLNKYIYSDVGQGFNPVSEALNEHNTRKKMGNTATNIKVEIDDNIKPKVNEDGEVITQVIPISSFKQNDDEGPKDQLPSAEPKIEKKK